MNIQEKAYTTKQVADYTGLASSTVRKYSQLLESEGYQFITSDIGARIFVENDVIALKYLRDMREKSNIKLDQAVAITVEKHSTQAVSLVDTRKETNNNEQHGKQYDELKQMIAKQDESIEIQNKLLKALTDKLDDQHDYIKNSIDDRDKKITELMKLTLDNKKMLDAPKKNWIDKLFRR